MGLIGFYQEQSRYYSTSTLVLNSTCHIWFLYNICMLHVGGLVILASIRICCVFLILLNLFLDVKYRKYLSTNSDETVLKLEIPNKFAWLENKLS